MIFLFEELRQLSCACRFTGSLETNHPDNRRFSVKTEGNIVITRTQKLCHLIMADFDNHVSRRDFRQNLLSDAFCSDFRNEVIDNIIVNIGFKQCLTNFP